MMNIFDIFCSVIAMAGLLVLTIMVFMVFWQKLRYWYLKKSTNNMPIDEMVNNAIDDVSLATARKLEPIIKEEESQPVYEKLGVNDCLIINKTESDLLVVCNEDGKPKVKRLSIPK